MIISVNSIITMLTIMDVFFQYSRSLLKQAMVLLTCSFLQACAPTDYWVLIIYDQNSVVASSFSIDGYDSKAACQRAAKQDYPEQRFLCVLEDDIG